MSNNPIPQKPTAMHVRSAAHPLQGIHFLLFIGLALLAGFGCKPKQVFLEPARLALVANGVEMRSVQVYNDKPIVMRRQANSSEVSQSGGRLVMVDGQQVLEVLIKAGTPGVVTGVQNGKFLVRFETGPGKILQFYKNSKGAYQIEAAKWVGLEGQVVYAGLEFLVTEDSNNCILLYEAKKSYRSMSKLRTLKGLKVPKGI